MNVDKDWAVNYWSKRLEETREEAEPILQKISFDLHSTKNLTVQEQWKLQAILGAYASYSKLLADDLAKPDPKPVPFWKKLFRK